jgi:hypothetical protein
VERRGRADNAPLHVAFVDPAGREVALDDVTMVRTAAYPA